MVPGGSVAVDAQHGRWPYMVVMNAAMHLLCTIFSSASASCARSFLSKLRTLPLHDTTQSKSVPVPLPSSRDGNRGDRQDRLTGLNLSR